MDNNQAVFTEIYRTNHWGSSESVSGPGAEMAQTEAVRAGLGRILSNYPIETMIDMPCGDFNWMQCVPEIASLRQYTGVDIVSALIRDLQDRYTAPNRTFIELDMVRDKVPQADLIFCRDCLVHLSNADALQALKNIKASGSKYLMTTTYVHEAANRDTHDGHWRPINLQAEPFGLPAMLDYVDTDYTDGGKHHPGNGMGLWKLQDLVV